MKTGAGKHGHQKNHILKSINNVEFCICNLLICNSTILVHQTIRTDVVELMPAQYTNNAAEKNDPKMEKNVNDSDLVPPIQLSISTIYSVKMLMFEPMIYTMNVGFY